MKHILTLSQQDVIPNAPPLDYATLRKREAARAVLLDQKGRVYLMNVSKHGYHKLPGGGVDKGEEILEALERELMEEVGCNADVIAELGIIVEYRDYGNGGLNQKSYCYLAKQVGKQAEASLEEGELDEGMFEVKANSIDEAIAILSSDKPDNLEGKFIQKRDLTFLRSAKNELSS